MLLALICLFIHGSHGLLSWRNSSGLALDTFSDAELRLVYDDWRKYYGVVDESRFDIFLLNWKSVIQWNDNPQKPSHFEQLNQFADLTQEEFVSQFPVTGKPHSGHEKMKRVSAARNVQDNLPSHVNWVKEGYVPPVLDCKHSESVASAIAVAATITCRGRHQDHSNKQLLSPQELIDCASAAPLAMENYTVVNGGLCNVAEYPVSDTWSRGSCNLNCGTHYDPVVSWMDVPSDETYSLRWVTAGGCALVYVDASGMQHYKKGIFKGPCTSKVNHIMTVVGYGKHDDGLTDDDDDRYWILQNEWGQDWGEQGYIRIKREKDYNDNSPGYCGILVNEVFPKMATP